MADRIFGAGSPPPGPEAGKPRGRVEPSSLASGAPAQPQNTSCAAAGVLLTRLIQD
jgi:hypothetical protein